MTDNYATAPEPPPIPRPCPMTESAHWQVMQDLAARAHFGQQKYGQPLTQHNGRNHLVDAYQELLDLLVYLRLALTTASAPQALEDIEREELVSLRRILTDPQACAEYLRSHGWTCLAPGETAKTPTTMCYDEMIAVLNGGGYVVYKEEDGHPALAEPALAQEAVSQGYRRAMLTTPDPDAPTAASHAMSEADAYAHLHSVPLHPPEGYTWKPALHVYPHDWSILRVAQHHWMLTHGGIPWNEETEREFIHLAVGKNWPTKFSYEDHKDALSRDADLEPWFPPLED